MHQVRTGSESWPAIVERIVAGACGAVPELPRDACRELVELIVVVRIRQTTACGRHPECRPDGAAIDGDTCGWRDPAPAALPAMFAAAAVDLARVSPDRRAALEPVVAAGLRAVLAGLVFDNPHCGRAAVCGAEPVHPLWVRRRS